MAGVSRSGGRFRNRTRRGTAAASGTHETGKAGGGEKGAATSNRKAQGGTEKRRGQKAQGGAEAGSQINWQEIAALDTEDDTKGQAYLACLSTWEIPPEKDGKGGIVKTQAYYDAEGSEETWREALINRLRECDIALVYCANLEYDTSNVFGLGVTLLTRTYVAGRMISGSMQLVGMERPVEFLDACFLENPPIPVRRMGEQIGLPKLEPPYRFDRYHKASDFIEYCGRDSEITLRWVSMVMGQFAALGCPGMGRTLPASSMRTFEHLWGDVPGLPSHHDFIRQAYYGGRCEIFRVGPVESYIHATDVASMYPYVMSVNKFPNPSSIREWRKGDPLHVTGVYRATVYYPITVKYPALPYRTDKLIFPVGKFSGVWSGAELLHALVFDGAKAEISEGIEFDQEYYPFTDFIERLFRQKEAGNPRAKFVMNSLYGKFAESGEIEEIGPKGRRKIKTQPAHANIIWSVLITAYARLHLLEGIRYVSHLIWCEPLYCDTDSIFYHSSVPTPLDKFNRKGLGNWTHKGTAELFEAKLPKLYRFGDTYHGKGVPLSEAAPYFFGEKVEYTAPRRFRESLARGETVNEWRQVTKQANAKYDKRTVLSGGDTRPIVLNG